MKTNIIIVAILSIAMFISSCTKEEGFGGKAIISGKVTYSQGAAEGAIISIAYGTLEATETFNTNTTAAADGSYKFEGLTPGDYYIHAKYVDSFGNTFHSTGYAITVGGKKSDIALDITVL